MKLADLHPEFSKLKDNVYSIQFDCPVCGSPWRCYINARLNGPKSHGVWSWTAKFNPMIDWNSVTIVPSINYANTSAHGRKRLCKAHFSISSGNVTMSK